MLLFGLGGMTRAAIAQGPPASPQTSFVSGRVLDDSSRALVGAEAVIAALKLRALTGPDGQFRLERLPLGRWSILVRAIGFLPYSQAVDVVRDGTELGVVSLHRAVVILPELEVTGKVPTPAFALGFGTNLDTSELCPGCAREPAGGPAGPRIAEWRPPALGGAHYLPFGASMTEDGLYLVPVQRFKATDPPFIMLRERPIGLGARPDHLLGRWIQCDRRSRPVATRIDGATARVLYSTGAVWFQRLEQGWEECFKAIPLMLDGVAIGAAPLAQGWVVAVEDSAGLTHLHGYNDYGRRLWNMPLAAVLGTAAQIKNVILASAGGGVTVSLTESPFSWALVDSTGSVMLQSSPFTGRAPNDLLTLTDLSGWRGYAVLPVRNGMVQTLESPRKRQGLFVLYDVLGRPVKVMRRAGASALIASAPELRMLLGYQYNSPWGGRSRLFMYRY